MRILYVTTVGMTMIFFKDLVKKLIGEGHTVDIACNESTGRVDDFYRALGCKIYQTDCSRSPLSPGNLKAVRELKKIVSKNRYDIVHCHTPVAGVCARLACKDLRKNGLKVFYTAHGFHFYKGAPLKNRLIYYPIEKLLSRYTDVLITINREDHKTAEAKLHARRTEYVPGVGVDTGRFKNTVAERAAKRKELGIPEDAFLLVSVGELNKNKNHQIVIRALARRNDPNIHYLIVGKGKLADRLEWMSRLMGVGGQIHFAGFRNDVAELYKISDAFILPSFREGLNVSLMEAMASGLPAVCSAVRGNTDLIDRPLFAPRDIGQINAAIADAALNKEEYVRRNLERIKGFDVSFVNERMAEIYAKPYPLADRRPDHIR